MTTIGLQERRYYSQQWEDFAQQFLQYVAEGHDGPVVLILQLAKMKMYKGTDIYYQKIRILFISKYLGV